MTTERERLESDLDTAAVEVLKARGAYLGQLRADHAAPCLVDLARDLAEAERRRAAVVALLSARDGETAA